MIQFQKLKSFSPTPEKDHLSVYRWFCREKLLGLEQCEWMRQPDDFISLVAPQSNRLERFVEDNLNTRPISWFKVGSILCTSQILNHALQSANQRFRSTCSPNLNATSLQKRRSIHSLLSASVCLPKYWLFA